MVLLSIVLVFALTACSGSSSTTTQSAATNTSAPVPVTTASKVYTLKFSEGNTEASAVGQIHKRWAEMIEQKSNGRIKVEMYFSSALASPAERLRSTQTGIADISYYTLGTDRNLMPLSMVTALPFVGMPSDMPKSTEIWWKLYNETPAIQKEWESVVLLCGASMPATQLHLTNKDAKVPDDLKGAKIISKGEQPNTIKALGASPVDLGVGDWYTSLERGLVTGIINHFPVLQVFKITELLPHHTIFGNQGVTMDMDMFIMNKDSWNKLPQDLQQVLKDASAWQNTAVMEMNKGEVVKATDAAKALNQTFTYLTDKEIEPWKAATKSAHQQWVDEFAAKGLPAQAVYDKLQEILKSY